MSDASPNAPSPVPDLSQLEADLARSLQPSWVNAPSKIPHHLETEDRMPPPGKHRSPRRSHPANQDPTRRPGKQSPRTERKYERPQPRQAPPAVIPGWDLRILPDPRGMDGIARQVRAAAKAYSLFDLAKLVLERPERYLVEFIKKDPTAPGLWMLSIDSSIWTSRKDAESHAFTMHAENFFRIEIIQGEPPKGNYAFVAQCGMSGEILGPPNHHEYLTKLRALHASRFSKMPFDAFKSRIRMVRDEETIEKWKESQSRSQMYFPQDSEEGLTHTAAEELFRKQMAGGVIAEVVSPAQVPGTVAFTACGSDIRRVVQEKLGQLLRFPLPLAHEIGSSMQARGLHIFKSSAKALHVSIARPKPLVAGDGTLADGIRIILEAVRNHPHTSRAEQWKAILAAKPLPEGVSEEDARRSLAADFSWLLHEGHLIDYARGGMETA